MQQAVKAAPLFVIADLPRVDVADPAERIHPIRVL
jgi:hypothetical protein